MKKLLFFVMIGFAVISFADKYDKWLNEEVKALITNEEREAFKSMKTDPEKEQFIKEFWEKRDPTPGTPENEYKDQFRKKVEQVNGLKIPSKKQAGSATDMGQTLLLLGQPTEQKKTEEKAAPSPGTEAEEEPPVVKQIWIYRNLSPEVASGEVQIQFEADPYSAEWKFSDNKKSQEILDKARAQELKNAKTALSTPQQTQPAVSSAPAQAETALATPAVKTALDATAAGNAPKDLAFDALVDSFLTSKDELFGTVAISASADTPPDKVGVRVLDSTGTIVKEMELAFVNPSEVPGYFQTKIPFTAPGDYSVILGVASGEKAGGVKQSLTIPDPAKFSVSSIILSKKFTQLPEAKPEMEPYTFGKIKVLPSVDRVFAKTDELILTYEAYNFQIDPATNKHQLEVVYKFQKDTDKPQETKPAAPNGLITGKKITIPTGFPLSTFPPGKYTLAVSLTDKASGQTAARETSFTVK